MGVKTIILESINHGKGEIKMQKQCVLLHGWGMNSNVWQQVLPQLHHDIPQVNFKALDLAGFGDNKALPSPYSLETIAAQIAQQLAPKTILVGWSLGGLVAIYIAKHWPEKVAKVVLVASTPLFSEQHDWPGIKVKVLENFTEQLQQNSTRTIERFLSIQALGSESAKDDIKALKIALAQSNPAHEIALKQGLAMLLNDDLRGDFASLTQPVAGIFGRLDALVPIKAEQQMRALNSHFSTVVIEKASHAPFISHKAEFTSALETLL